MLAIIIPYYKKIYFKDTLDSLANQTDQRFNLYVGNDASPEDPCEIIEQYRQKLNLKYTIFDDNLGRTSLTGQWERCIELVGDEKWIMLLADDDVLGKKVVEEFHRQLPKINLSGAKVIKFATQEINGNGKKISETFYHPKLQDYSDSFYELFFTGSRSSLSEHIFSRRQFEKYGFRNFPLAWHADDMAWMEFSEFGKIFSINEALVYFRLSEFNISRHGYRHDEKMKIRYLFFTTIVEEYLQKFKKEHSQDILKKYELMTYSFNKGDFAFWRWFFPLMLRYFNVWEGLKFTRRVYINYGRKK